MADKLKAPKDGKPNAFAQKIPSLATSIARVNDLKERAKEANGSAGSATKDAIDTLHFNKWAFTSLAQTKKKEPTEQQDRILSFVAGALGLGMLSQADGFDDRLRFIHAEIGKLLDGSPRPAAAGMENVTKLASMAAH